MEFLYFAGDIMKLKGRTLIVCKCILVPIINDGTLDICIKTAERFH